MNIEPGCRWRIRITGDIACMQPDAIDWAGIAQYTAYVLLVIVPLLVILGFIVYQLRRQHREQVMEEAIQQARFNRFLELLRDVRMRLMD